MADIALLVVEEFERRKKWEKAHRVVDGARKTAPEEIGSFRLSAALSSLGGKLREEVVFLKAQVAPPPPESSVALAAFDGLFSA